MKVGLIRKSAILCALIISAMALSVTATAGTVAVCFWSDGVLKVVQRQMPAGTDGVEGAIYALALGPTAEEKAAGIGSAIPEGTLIMSLAANDRRVTVDFSREILSGFGEAALVAIFDQTRWTVWMNGPEREVVLTCGGAPLSSFLPPTPVITPRREPAAARRVLSDGTALSSRKITISAGHGKVWTGAAYGFQRGLTCVSTGLAREDDHNLEMIQYLEKYLLSDGATVKVPRCTDKNYGTHTPSGEPW